MKTPERERYPVHVRRVPRTWWLRTGPYRRFAAREFTSVFVAAFSVIFLLFLFALQRGREAYGSFLRWLDQDGLIALFAVIFVATVYHTLTFSRLTAHVQVVRVGRRTLPRRAVQAALIGGWLVASGVLAYFHVWF